MSETLLSREHRTTACRRGGGSSRRVESAGASVEVAATEFMARQLRPLAAARRREARRWREWQPAWELWE
uniref:Uncharacterized protein n=1 Tax=Arundo donax TaxID=35708 RepID=A0A0A8XTV9_ARUDO